MRVEKLDYFGRGIIREKNKVIFVKNALPKEEVEFKIVKENKKYSEAEVTNIGNFHPSRRKLTCFYNDSCGGCMLRHMDYSYQMEFKRKKVEEILSRYLEKKVVVKNIVESRQDNYRNRVTLHVKEGRIGFFESRTNQLIEINKCLLLKNKINEIIVKLKSYVKIEKGITKITIKLGNKTNEVMIILEGSIKSYQEILSLADVLIVNDKTVTDKRNIMSFIGDKKYLISKNSFFQVNEEVTTKLYDKILSIIKENKASNVLDLYCGTGTIGIYISSYVKKVIGVEVVEDAIKDANVNKKNNETSNISFITGKVENQLEIFKENFDTIIIDPPRSGLKKVIIDTLNKKKVKTIIYVSCNPITLGRDLKQLCTNYNIVEVTPFDMFPNTYHVECVCVLNRLLLETEQI